MFIQLGVALSLGAIVGLERLLAGKEAGMRTFGLVSVGACLFVMIGEMVILGYGDRFNFDPTRLVSSVVTGIGSNRWPNNEHAPSLGVSPGPC